MRTRSQHSIATPSEKAGSAENLIPKGEILEHKLYRVGLKELTKYKTKDGKYNGIIRIIDSKMLQTCYSLIKSKPGNMTAGAESITLEGLNLRWFEKTAKDIQEGRFKFSPARQFLNPKPNKPGEIRPLNIASPSDLIVQKAIQVVIKAIYEPHLSKTSKGFIPGRSLINALNRNHKVNLCSFRLCLACLKQVSKGIYNPKGRSKGWAINEDITKCFDRIPHDTILTTIQKRITCVRTLTLIERGLKAGFIDPLLLCEPAALLLPLSLLPNAEKQREQRLTLLTFAPSKVEQLARIEAKGLAKGRNKEKGNLIYIQHQFRSSRKKNTHNSTQRKAVEAPIKLLTEKMIKNGFARRNHLAKVLAKGRTDMVHLTHYDIIRFFNSKISGLLTAYSFAGNIANLARVIWVLRQSCALTLARKFKLKTMSKAFKKFGYDLQDPATGVSLNTPDIYKATYDFNSKPHAYDGNPEK